MDCSMPGFAVIHHLTEFAQMHVHSFGDAIQPSHPLVARFSSCPQSPPLLAPSKNIWITMRTKHFEARSWTLQKVAQRLLWKICTAPVPESCLEGAGEARLQGGWPMGPSSVF